MECLKCARLEQTFESRLSDYNEARFSAFYQVSTELAAKKNVDLERARYDLEEHQLTCFSHLTGALDVNSQHVDLPVDGLSEPGLISKEAE
jgi:hypothetical protein